MPPTIQTGRLGERENRGLRSTAVEKNRSEMACRVKYCNTLPDIPFDPKFISYPFETNRFVQYNPTSLERNYKHDMLTEHDLGVTIDLINPDTYAVDPLAVLDFLDEKLLEEEVNAPQDSKRSQHHAKRVSWLRRTEYISTEYTRFQPSSDKTETKVGYNVKKFFKEQDLYMDRESQIKAIDKTFDDAKLTIEKHYSKPGVTPLEVLEVFPDFELWRYPSAQVIFDSDPAPANRSFPAQIEEMSQAMIRGVVDESGEQFVAYFLPTEETTSKRKRDTEEGDEYKDDEEYDYKMAREYNWNVKNKASKGYEENYFFVFRESGVFYNELETKVRLSKRRVKAGVQPNNSRLIVKHRPLNEQEFKIQEVRMMQLEPPQEEEEEEMEVDKNETEDADIEDKDEDKESESDKEEDNAESNSDENDSDGEKQNADADSDDENEKEVADSDKDDEAASGKEEEDEEEDNDEREAGSDKEDEVPATAKSPSSSSSADEASASDKSSSESGSESEADEEQEQKRRDAAEIFGSGSDSDD